MWIVFAIAVILLVSIAACMIDHNVRSYATPIYGIPQTAPTMPVAIVFGAGCSGHLLSPILEDRVQTGIELYKAGRVRKLLMTGDMGHSGDNEPEAMKRAAVEAGIPAADIVCDYAGFRTYDSLYRARDVFGTNSASLVTQRYHLPRAMFIARNLGVDVVGVDAAKRSYLGQRSYNFREIAAVQAAWVEVNVLHRRPKVLGKKEPIFGGDNS